MKKAPKSKKEIETSNIRIQCKTDKSGIEGFESVPDPGLR